MSLTLEERRGAEAEAKRALGVCLDKLMETARPFIFVFGPNLSGKTDFSLLAAEIARDTGIVKLFASNIRTECDWIEHITNFRDLKRWLRSHPKKMRKLFIFDEAPLAIHARRSTSKLNVKFTQEATIIRKYRCKVIIISLEPTPLDKLAYDDILIAGVVLKYCKKEAIIDSDQFPRRIRVLNIPRTSVPFDTYDVSLFKLDKDLSDLEEEAKEGKGPLARVSKRDRERFLAWFRTMNYTETANQFDLKPQQIKDSVRKVVNKLLDVEDQGRPSERGEGVMA